MNDVVVEALCFRLADEAEAARWRSDDIAWDRLDHARVTPALVSLVREIAFSELTTTTATRRFLTDLADDVDLTQWISVWFYEETRHPQVLLRWLHEVGVTVDGRFLARGRATAPFMKSRIGTLVTNVISEVAASAAYAGLHVRAGEPVLASIAKNLAADEARHAASFYAYARRHLEQSSDPDADRRDALKVLFLWVEDTGQVQHPVSEFYARNATAMTELAFEPTLPRARIIQLVGTLIGVPLEDERDLSAHVRELGPRRAEGHTA